MSEGATIIDDIPFQVNESELFRMLHAEPDGLFSDDIHDLCRQAEAAARPKGILKASSARTEGDERVIIDGVEFKSRVLCVNLKEVEQVFPYVATCGQELEDWSAQLKDVMHRFWADSVKEMALRQAVAHLGDYLTEKYEAGRRGSMNPGSLPDWPMAQQRPLFQIFGDEVKAIGVSLSDSYIMYPMKSVSGVWFQTEKGFQNCQLCPMEKCPNRRAPYEAGRFDEEYNQT
jgi:hypothetical protein